MKRRLLPDRLPVISESRPQRQHRRDINAEIRRHHSEHDVAQIYLAFARLIIKALPGNALISGDHAVKLLSTLEQRVSPRCFEHPHQPPEHGRTTQHRRLKPGLLVPRNNNFRRRQLPIITDVLQNPPSFLVLAPLDAICNANMREEESLLEL